MTIGNLWLPSLGAPVTSTNFFQVSGTFDSASFASPQTVTLPGSYTTLSNDLIVVVVAVSGSTDPTVTGCGATWVKNVSSFMVGPDVTMWIGYGCTAGGTSISIAGVGATTGSVCIGVNSGNFGASNPILTQIGSPSSFTGTSITSGNVTCTHTAPHTIVIPMCCGSGGTNEFSIGSPPTFTGGKTGVVSNIGIDNNNRATRLDYTTTTVTIVNGDNVAFTYTQSPSAKFGCWSFCLQTTTP